MKVLLLSCNTGGGHNSAAKAIAEELLTHGDEAYVLDYLCLAGKGVSKLVGGRICEDCEENSSFIWTYIQIRNGDQSSHPEITCLLYQRMYGQISQQLSERTSHRRFDHAASLSC